MFAVGLDGKAVDVDDSEADAAILGFRALVAEDGKG